MQTWHNWRVKRSGAALRIIGDCRENGAEIKGHKRSDIGSIEPNGRDIIAYSRNTGMPVAILTIV